MQISNEVTFSEISDSNRAKFMYCSHFCEENVYKMACNFVEDMRSELENCPSVCFFVVFISSECKKTPVWHQKAGVQDEPVLWDYHVVLVAKGISQHLLRKICSDVVNDSAESAETPRGGEKSRGQLEIESRQQPITHIVFDLDTVLPFPTDAKQYYTRSFRPEISLPASYEQRFRVIPAEDVINHFSSDR